MTRAKPKNPNLCKDCGQRLMDGNRPTRCLIDWTRHPRPANATDLVPAKAFYNAPRWVL